LPWSVPAFASGGPASFASWLIPAILNVVLHAVGRWLIAHRRTPSDSSRTSEQQAHGRTSRRPFAVDAVMAVANHHEVVTIIYIVLPLVLVAHVHRG